MRRVDDCPKDRRRGKTKRPLLTLFLLFSLVLIQSGWGELAAFDQAPLLCLDFEGSLQGSQREEPIIAENVGFLSSPEGQGVRTFEGGTLHYCAEGNIDHGGGAIEIRLQKLWDPSPLSHFIFVAGVERENGLEFNKDQLHNLRFITWRDGRECGAACSTRGWEAGSWHDIRGEWGKDGVFLYVDGELVASNNKRGTYQPPRRLVSPIRIGCHPTVGVKWSDMVIDRVVVSGPGVVQAADPAPESTRPGMRRVGPTPTPVPEVTPTPMAICFDGPGQPCEPVPPDILDFVDVDGEFGG